MPAAPERVRVEHVRERDRVTQIERQRIQAPEPSRAPKQQPTEQPTRAPVIKVPDIPDTGNKDIDKLKDDVEHTKDEVLKGTPLDGVL